MSLVFADLPEPMPHKYRWQVCACGDDVDGDDGYNGGGDKDDLIMVVPSSWNSYLLRCHGVIPKARVRLLLSEMCQLWVPHLRNTQCM